MTETTKTPPAGVPIGASGQPTVPAGAEAPDSQDGSPVLGSAETARASAATLAILVEGIHPLQSVEESSRRDYQGNERLRLFLRSLPESMGRKIYFLLTHPHIIRGRNMGPGHQILLTDRLRSDILFGLPLWDEFKETTVRVYGRAFQSFFSGKNLTPSKEAEYYMDLLVVRNARAPFEFLVVGAVEQKGPDDGIRPYHDKTLTTQLEKSIFETLASLWSVVFEGPPRIAYTLGGSNRGRYAVPYDYLELNLHWMAHRIRNTNSLHEAVLVFVHEARHRMQRLQKDLRLFDLKSADGFIKGREVFDVYPKGEGESPIEIDARIITQKAHEILLAGGTPVDAVRAVIAKPPTLAGKRVLVVDDQQVIVDLVARHLGMWDVEVVTTTDPQEALRRLQSEDFDLLVTDLMMPGLDGVSLMNKLIEAGRFVPTLVLSGSQGNHAAAAMHDDLANQRFREAALPILYMQKLSKDFAAKLADRLLYLAQQPRFDGARVASEALPFFREVVAQESAGEDVGSASFNERRKIIFTNLIDYFLDCRFALLVEAEPLVAELKALTLSLPTGGREEDGLRRCLSMWDGIQRQTRQALLMLNSDGWHTYKSQEPLPYWRILESVRECCEGIPSIPEGLKEKVGRIEKMAESLAKITWFIQQTYLVAGQKNKLITDLFQTILKQAKSSVDGQFETDFPSDQPIEIMISSPLFWDVPEMLLTNAIQATPLGNPLPILRARLVEANDIFSAMDVAPEADDPVVNPHRPATDKIAGRSGRYIYLGVVNHGAPISDENRRKMVSAEPFTTKKFGTGVGITIVHENLRKVEGWLEVQSRGGKTEVGVFIPLDPYVPSKGSSGSGEQTGGEPVLDKGALPAIASSALTSAPTLGIGANVLVAGDQPVVKRAPPSSHSGLSPHASPCFRLHSIFGAPQRARPVARAPMRVMY